MNVIFTLAAMIPVLSSAPAAPTDGTPYPAEVRRAFLASCVGTARELIPACRCMINGFEMRMPLDEFEKMTQVKNPTQDARFTTVANHCINAQ